MTANTAAPAGANPTATDPSNNGDGSVIGFLLARVIVPLWILAGAIAKLVTLNPNFLPAPVLDVTKAIGSMIGFEDMIAWVAFSMRLMIATELAIAFTMILVPRLARALGIALLALFCAILAVVLVQEVGKTGMSALFGGSCGCFGSASPPPSVMLLIDAVLLAGLIWFRPLLTSIVPRSLLVPVTAIALLLSLTLPFMLQPEAITLDADDAGGPAVAGWPERPTTLENFYLVDEDTWAGRRLSEIDVMALLPRPLPDGIDEGVWHVMLYRANCDACHDLMIERFSDERTARLLTIAIPIDDPMSALEYPLSDTVDVELPRGPDYVVQTPVLFAVRDGAIAAVCSDTDDPEAVDEILAITGEGATGAGASGGGETTPPVATGWPPRPSTTQPFYLFEFDQWTGRRLSALPEMQLLARPVPAGIDEGDWHLLFYRADCDHCHELMVTRFDGARETRLLTVSIPIDDPSAAMDYPLRDTIDVAMPTGPQYVIGTPVVVAVRDGVVTGVCEDTDDEALLERVLAFTGAGDRS